MIDTASPSFPIPHHKVKLDGLAKLNVLPVTDLKTELLRICGSRVWVEAVAKTFPHTSPASVLTAMDKAWWSLSKPDYLEAFSAHPCIGDAAALKRVSHCAMQFIEFYCLEDFSMRPLQERNPPVYFLFLHNIIRNTRRRPWSLAAQIVRHGKQTNKKGQ